LANESRLDQSVVRIMQQKFALGLFDNPYVDVDNAASLAGNNEFQALATAAQRQSLVLLENKEALLPMSLQGKRVFLHGVDAMVAEQYGLDVVDSPEQADFALIRAATPFEVLHPNYVFGRMQHEGDLSFHEDNP